SYPAFFDYDNDGLEDLVIGNYNYYQPAGGCKSGLSLYRNTGTNSTPSFQLITRDFAGLFNATFCNGFCNDPHPTFGDIDGDSDLDMLIGDFCGKLQLYLNNGANNLTAFGVNGIPSVANFQGIDIGSNAAPQLVDVDRDGKLDLIVGKRSGVITYYHNSGTTTNAVFTWVTDLWGNVDVSYLTSGYSCPFLYDDSGSYRLLVGNELGYAFRYGNIDGNLSGSFTLNDTLIDRVEGGRVCPGMGDINGDGLPDLLLGNYAGGVSLFYWDNPVGVTSQNRFEAGPGMEIFPNPSNSQTEVQFSNLNPATVSILKVFDVTGQKLFSLSCSSPSLMLDVSALSAGIYMLRLEDGKHSVVRKLMVY
ncbi:MAG: T9SS type A sorting domain-containing protein, partial [Bacteroidia bacterium]|nr:T9SS type A sorting domain-containing protein [Bacteroidia bacterium]